MKNTVSWCLIKRASIRCYLCTNLRLNKRIVNGWPPWLINEMNGVEWDRGPSLPQHTPFIRASSGLHKTELWVGGKSLGLPGWLNEYAGLWRGQGEKATGTTPRSYYDCLEEAPFNKLWNWLFFSWYPEIPFSETLLVNQWGRFSILPNPKTVDLQIHLTSYIISYRFSDGILL